MIIRSQLTMNKKPKHSPSFSLTNNPFLFLLLLLFIPMLSLFLFLLLLFSSPSLSSSSSSLIISQACQASLSPPSCISSLSSLPPPSSPTDLISSLLSLISLNLQTSLSHSHSILNSSRSNPALSNAALNCIDHLTLSSYRISSSIPFLSAALLYQYDCWSALKYVNSSHLVASSMLFLSSSLIPLTSDALSFSISLLRFGPSDLSLWSPPQTERQGYWPPTTNHDDDQHISLAFPPDLLADVTVCKDACTYTSVQDAVDAAPDRSPSRFLIRIKSGVYEETVRVPFDKTNLVFVGDGMGQTIITGKLNAQMTGVTTYNTATVGVAGDGFMARDITFQNAAGPGSHQAVAFRSDSDRSLLYSVEFLGHQDTLYARSLRQFYHSCRIAGTVDFIFGNSASVFYNCSVVVVPRQEGPEKGESDAVTAHGRTDPGQATGFVFRNSSVDGSEEYVEIYKTRPGRHKVYLGRPWKEYSRTVYLGCYLGEMVRPEGWMPWRGEFALKTLFYGEYASLGLGANRSGRVDWSSEIPEEHLGVYSVRNFIQGDEWEMSSK